MSAKQSLRVTLLLGGMAGCGTLVGLNDDARDVHAADAGAETSRDEPIADAEEASVDASVDAAPVRLDDPNWAGWPLPEDQFAELSLEGDVVRDPVTGLDWHATTSEDLTFGEMPGYCEESRLGGFADWRVPSWIELMSVIDFGHEQPALNPGVFHAPSTGHLLAATRFSENRVLGAMLLDGRYNVVDPESLQTYVQCVRGPRPVGTAPSQRYDIGENVVTDRFTGLTWQRETRTERMTFANASAACAQLDLEGGGWKVPNIKQLLSIFDPIAQTPTRWHVPAFGTTVVRGTWSRTLGQGRTNHFWSLDFGAFGQSLEEDDETLVVRCVRD